MNGRDGRDGVSFFSLFIDDFFGAAGTSLPGLPVTPVPIVEPALGRPDDQSGQVRAVAYRFAVPHSYGPGNPVTMRLFFYRIGPLAVNDCFVFQLDARSLQHGGDIEVYGGIDPGTPDPRWVRPDINRNAVVPGGGLFWVVDLPINRPGGLGYSNDLVEGQFLAIELNTFTHDDGLYELLGVEVYESEEADAVLSGATVYTDVNDVTCDLQGED